MRNQWPVNPTRELLQALKERDAVNNHRKGLDNPNLGICLHRGSESHDDLAGHQAVSIEYNHLRIVAAKPSDPLGYVTGFAFGILCPAAVKQPGGAYLSPHSEEREFLGNPDFRVGGVAQDEEFELVA